MKEEIYKRITDKKTLEKLIKNSNDIIKEETSEIVLYKKEKAKEVKMKQTWTKDQKEYLDDKFSKINERFVLIERAILENAKAIKEIKNILIRNGMK